MKKYDFDKLIENQQLVAKNINEFLDKNILRKQSIDKEEIKGHVLKADHNLRFISHNINSEFLDWTIAGCYYACYHAALGLILTKGYFSKNHNATLCVLIKEFYDKDLEKDDLSVISELLEYQDLLSYVEQKDKREDAQYSTKTKFDKKDVERLRIKSMLLVSKCKSLIEKFIS